MDYEKIPQPHEEEEGEEWDDEQPFKFADKETGRQRKSETFFRTRKFRVTALVGILLIASVVAATIVTVSLTSFGNNDGDDPRFDIPGMKTEVFQTKPITIGQGEHLQLVIENVPRPKGDVAIHGVSYHFKDRFGERIPLEKLYNHHMSIVDERIKGSEFGEVGFIGIFGAESELSKQQFPSPYVVTSPGNVNWMIGFYLIDLWGVAATANTTFTVEYTVNYTRPEEGHKEIFPLIVGEMGNSGSAKFEVPGDGAHQDSVFKIESLFTWNLPDADLVLTHGHVHIQSLNVTLIESKTQEVISSCVTIHDDFGFVVNIADDFPEDVTLTKGTKYELKSFYRNTVYLEQVMSLMLLWVHIPNWNNTDWRDKYETSAKRSLEGHSIDGEGLISPKSYFSI